jgi:hypothetical protein
MSQGQNNNMNGNGFYQQPQPNLHGYIPPSQQPSNMMPFGYPHQQQQQQQYPQNMAQQQYGYPQQNNQQQQGPPFPQSVVNHHYGTSVNAFFTSSGTYNLNLNLNNGAQQLQPQNNNNGYNNNGQQMPLNHQQYPYGNNGM